MVDQSSRSRYQDVYTAVNLTVIIAAATQQSEHENPLTPSTGTRTHARAHARTHTDRGTYLTRVSVFRSTERLF